MFNSIFDAVIGMTDTDILLCTLVSLLCGAAAAFTYSRDERASRSLTAALVVLPLIVQAVIMTVNGNLGIGVAVMGAFSLVRFRSMPGSAKDIVMIFLAMASGLSAGVGCLIFAAALTVSVCVVYVAAQKIIFGHSDNEERTLKITIPENLDYCGIFDDIFTGFTSYHKLLRVKTVNMGTMYELHYAVKLRNVENEKKMIDEIRCRNGNLTVICGRTADNEGML